MDGMDEKLPDYIAELNPQQRQAALHSGAPLLILAGAGSGKTRVIVAKIAWLLEREGVDPRSILAVTFTNKAAREMAGRIKEITPLAGQVMLRTFHSFGAWVLRHHSKLSGLPGSFAIYDDDDSSYVIQSVAPDWVDKKMARSYQREISRCKDHAITPQQVEQQFKSHLPDFAAIYQLYQDKMASMGCVDFGDLITLTIELLQKHPQVRNRLQQRFSTVLVDEYQDSNISQYQLLQQLFCADNYLCVVGDDDQSIYRFRGAVIDNILTFQQKFTGAEIIRLEQNYRSTQSILTLAEAVVRRNESRIGKKLWTENNQGEPPTLFFVADQNEEAKICADILQDGSGLSTAILYRTNAQSQPFESLFARLAIPYRIVGALRFYEREEIKDSLAFLAFLLNPRDEIAWRRIINKPSRGIGKSSQSKVLEAAAQLNGDLLTAGEKFAGGSRAAAGLQKFSTIIKQLHQSLADDPLTTTIGKIVEQSGLLDYYRQQDESGLTHKVSNLEQLQFAAAEYPPGNDGLITFLEDISLDRERIRLLDKDDDSTAVTLITMHNTKGLEYDQVIITGMEDGLFPSGRDAGVSAIEEERRIFYVAITRARQKLYLTSCQSRFLWGRTAVMSPSTFILEMADGLIQQINMRQPAIGYGSYQNSGEQKQNGKYFRGQRVYHQDYGEGEVVDVRTGADKTAVDVRFFSGKKYTSIPDFDSNLEIISS